MRLTSLAPPLACIALVIVAACEQAEESPPPRPAPRVEMPVSDELPGLPTPASGVAFWDHPTLPFNSMLIVAGAQGALAYNIEDGVEAARIDAVAAEGAAVSYAGYGPQAAGVLALFDRAENAFRFYGVDNLSRQFAPLGAGLENGLTVDGAVHGFCFGRARGTAAPSLFVLQDGQILIFNFDAAEEGLAPAGEGAIETPEGLASCAVDIDGVLLAAARSGAIYRIDGPDSFAAPFASAATAEAGDLSIAASTAQGNEGAQEISGQIILLDKADGAAHVFNRADGAPLGVVTVAATDQLPGVASAHAMGLTAANLGALYRNGVVAYAVTGEDGPAIRLIPYNAVLNALALPEGTALSPRGAAPTTGGTGLIIDTPPLTPGQ